MRKNAKSAENAVKFAVKKPFDLPQYLHGIDEAAERLWETMNEKLSKDERYKHTGDYLSDVKKENEKKQIIVEEILSSIVYVG